MTGPASTSAAAVAQERVQHDAIYDLQTQFVMVPYGHLQAVNRRVGGVERARLAGFVVELHRRAAAQGRVGDGSHVLTSQQKLAAELGISRHAASKYLKRVASAHIVVVSGTEWDPQTNGTESIRVDFKGNRLPFAQLSMPALTLIARGARGTNYLGALGLYATLRWICWEQRAEHGDRYALISRNALAEMVGTSPRWVTYTGQLLERQGVIRREEQLTAHRGNTTMNWWLLNVTNEHVADALARAEQAHETDAEPKTDPDQTPGKKTTSTRGKKQPDPGEENDLDTRKKTTNTAANFPEHPGANVDGDPAATVPTYAGAHEQGSENDFTDDSSPPDSVNFASATDQGRSAPHDQADSECVAICETFAAWLVADTSPAVLESPGSWHTARREWLQAARRLLDDGYDATRIGEILQDLADDFKYGDQLQRVTDLPPRIHQLAKRAAHRRRARAAQSAAPGGDIDFDGAFAEITKLIERLGRAGYEEAKPALAALGEHHERFVTAAGWRRLCEATHFDQGSLRRIWRDTATAERSAP
jgi:hypothetical protein